MNRFLTLVLLLATLGWGGGGVSPAGDWIGSPEAGFAASAGAGADGCPEGPGLERDSVGPRPDILFPEFAAAPERLRWPVAGRAPVAAHREAHLIRAPPPTVTLV